MRIPAYLLRQEVTIEPYEGEGAYGPVYGASVSARCRIEPSQGLVTDRQGTEVVAKAVAYLLPDANIAAESRLTWARQTYRVVESRPIYGRSKPAYIKAVLE